MSKDLYALSSYQYDLPEELIAQFPVEPRDSSRLMIVNRKTGQIETTSFRALSSLCKRGDQLVVNDTRVIPARLLGKRKSGGATEVFLTHRHSDGTWDALVRPARKCGIGSQIEFSKTLSCEVIGILADGERHVRFQCDGPFEELLEQHGQIPLPHYIRREANQKDSTTYQTIYAQNPGAVAAPTAGLHFTEQLLGELKDKGVSRVAVTLHVGLGTFKPVMTEDVREHLMHEELSLITERTAELLNQPLGKGNRRICVGTTCCRALESATNDAGLVVPGRAKTNIFIYPGYRFKYVDALLTNFHLPGSTLLMLVSAFAGYELIREAYAKAIEQKFRFFSYGDSMLII